MKKLLTLLLSLALTSFTDTLLRYSERITANRCTGCAENEVSLDFTYMSNRTILPSSNEEGFML